MKKTWIIYSEGQSSEDLQDAGWVTNHATKRDAVEEIRWRYVTDLTVRKWRPGFYEVNVSGMNFYIENI